jgi:hypothetical protein
MIEDWRSRYGNVARLENYITGLLSDVNNSQLLRSQRRVIPVLARLALLKDTVEELLEQHGTLYRWVWQYESTMAEEGEAIIGGTKLATSMVAAGKRSSEHHCPTVARWVVE